AVSIHGRKDKIGNEEGVWVLENRAGNDAVGYRRGRDSEAKRLVTDRASGLGIIEIVQPDREYARAFAPLPERDPPWTHADATTEGRLVEVRHLAGFRFEHEESEGTELLAAFVFRLEALDDKRDPAAADGEIKDVACGRTDEGRAQAAGYGA